MTEMPARYNTVNKHLRGWWDDQPPEWKSLLTDHLCTRTTAAEKEAWAEQLLKWCNGDEINKELMLRTLHDVARGGL